MPAKAIHRHTARCIWDAAASLGEGPLWMADEGALYWVDILQGDVLRYTPASARREKCRMPVAMSSLAPMTHGRLICTAQRDVCVFDTANGDVHRVQSLETAATGIRINDGCCHPDGSFWFGTMDLQERQASGAFFRLDATGSCVEIAAPYIISNGPAFGPGGEQAYFVDTLGRRILRASIQPDGMPATLQTFVRIPDQDGYPDGLAIDADGGIWCAHWGGSRITRFNAHGAITDIVELPVSNVTKCAFGGKHLDRLYITTARKDLDGRALATQPLAGGLFEADVGFAGVLPAKYSGRRERGAMLGHACFFEGS